MRLGILLFFLSATGFGQNVELIFNSPLEIPEGEEKDEVVRSLAANIKAVAAVIEDLPPQTRTEAAPEDSPETPA